MNRNGLQYEIELALKQSGVTEGINTVLASMQQLQETTSQVGTVAATVGDKMLKGISHVSQAASKVSETHAKIRFILELQNIPCQDVSLYYTHYANAAR